MILDKLVLLCLSQLHSPLDYLTMGPAFHRIEKSNITKLNKVYIINLHTKLVIVTQGCLSIYTKIEVYMCLVWTPKTLDQFYVEYPGNLHISPVGNFVKFDIDRINSFLFASGHRYIIRASRAKPV